MAELAAIPDALERFETAMAPAREVDIAVMIGKMALLFPTGKLSATESAARLDLYLELLGDLPADVLRFGFNEVAKISRFFPTVAEIREAAEPMLRDRRAIISALRSLRMKAGFEGAREH